QPRLRPSPQPGPGSHLGVQSVRTDDDTGPDLTGSGGDADHPLRGIANEPGDPLPLPHGRMRLPPNRVNQRFVKAGAPNAEPFRRSAVRRNRERQMDPGTTLRKPIRDPSKRPRPRLEA